MRFFSSEKKTEFCKKTCGFILLKVLEHAGVFKCNEEGLAAFERFIEKL